MRHLLLFISILLYQIFTYAQEVVEAVVPAAESDPLGFIDKAIAFLAGIEATWIVGLTILIEFVFRLVKTDKPKSIMYLISDGCRGIGAVLNKVATILDKILPQRTV